MQEANIPSHVESLGTSGKHLAADKAGASELRSSGQARGGSCCWPGVGGGVTEDGMIGVRLMREE